jgi:hypothetical protein
VYLAPFFLDNESSQNDLNILNTGRYYRKSSCALYISGGGFSPMLCGKKGSVLAAHKRLLVADSSQSPDRRLMVALGVSSRCVYCALEDSESHAGTNLTEYHAVAASPWARQKICISCCAAHPRGVNARERTAAHGERTAAIPQGSHSNGQNRRI